MKKEEQFALFLPIIVVLILFITVFNPAHRDSEEPINVNVTTDTTTASEGLSPEACTDMGGRIVNIVGGETCNDDEVFAGDVIGFISPNICCLSQETLASINSFEECARAGFPIMESYPMQCRTTDGRTFVQEISMSEKEARSFAETSGVCLAEGEIGEFEVHNTITQTWWFTLLPNEPKEGCAPACVVNEVTKDTEINWRCTGLILPTDDE